MLTISVEKGVVGAGDPLRYGSGSSKINALLKVDSYKTIIFKKF
jgi:hypothetical protein